jgi:pimeloyl-ACP methyl ester carboxylesterase
VDQQIRFCTAPDGVRVAYAVHGHGPPIVRAATWLTHLEFDWASPVWRHWLEGLTAGHTLVRYDERGCGLSDREVGHLSVDTWVADLETVVDAVGIDRFALLGISQAAAITLAYATRHPERVSHLILYGGYARGRKLRGQRPQTHGRADRIVQPSMAEHVLDVCGSAEASWYDGVGHMPFLEVPARFDHELAQFVARVR